MKPKNKPGFRWVQIKARDVTAMLIEVPEKDLISAGYTKEELKFGVQTMRSWPPATTKKTTNNMKA